MPRDSDPLVFSTDGSHLQTCVRCGANPCTCPAAEIVPRDHTLRLRLEKKGRKGKAVTLVVDLPTHPSYFRALLKQLKGHCGTGGAMKDGNLELQGDQRVKAREFLERLGFTVRQVGG